MRTINTIPQNLKNAHNLHLYVFFRGLAHQQGQLLQAVSHIKTKLKYKISEEGAKFFNTSVSRQVILIQR